PRWDGWQGFLIRRAPIRPVRQPHQSPQPRAGSGLQPAGSDRPGSFVRDPPYGREVQSVRDAVRASDVASVRGIAPRAPNVEGRPERDPGMTSRPASPKTGTLTPPPAAVPPFPKGAPPPCPATPEGRGRLASDPLRKHGPPVASGEEPRWAITWPPLRAVGTACYAVRKVGSVRSKKSLPTPLKQSGNSPESHRTRNSTSGMACRSTGSKPWG